MPSASVIVPASSSLPRSPAYWKPRIVPADFSNGVKSGRWSEK